MDRLPQEIIDLIARNIIPHGTQESLQDDVRKRSKPPANITANVRRLHTKFSTKAKSRRQRDLQTARIPLAPVATVSRKWQDAIERITFADVSFTSDELQDFIVVFSSRPRRRQLLRAAAYTIVMPVTPSQELLTPKSYKGNHDARAIVAGTLLRPLFTFLSSWDDSNSVHLRLAIATNDDPVRPLSTSHAIAVAGVSRFPIVSCVRRLSFHPLHSTMYVFLPGAQSRIASRVSLSSLDHVAFCWEDTPFAPLTFHYRQSAAQDLSRFLESQPIPKISLTILSEPCDFLLDTHKSWGKEVHDPFLAQLRTATTNAVDLCYSGWVDESFFWPQHHYSDDYSTGSYLGENPNPPIWGSLRHLTVYMSLVTPTGTWYFDDRAAEKLFGSEVDDFLQVVGERPYRPARERNQGSSASETATDPLGWLPKRHIRTGDWQRHNPVGETMNPLLLSFARLLESSSVSALQTAQIVARRGLNARPWVVCYCAPGLTSHHVSFDRSSIDRPRVWIVSELWKPSTQVVDAFRKAGSATHKEDAAVILWRSPNRPFAGFYMR